MYSDSFAISLALLLATTGKACISWRLTNFISILKILSTPNLSLSLSPLLRDMINPNLPIFLDTDASLIPLFLSNTIKIDSLPIYIFLLTWSFLMMSFVWYAISLVLLLAPTGALFIPWMLTIFILPFFALITILSFLSLNHLWKTTITINMYITFTINLLFVFLSFLNKILNKIEPILYFIFLL